MKKNWPITILICILLLGGGAIVLLWPRTVPFEQCSEIYQKYANVEDIKVSFIKDFKVNDTVFVDVTLLEAIDSTGWDILQHEFAIPALEPPLKQVVEQKKDLVISKLVEKGDYHKPASPSSLDCEIMAFSYGSQTICIFHIKNLEERHAVLYHNLDKSTN